ncbi:MAG TPA: hypothetical protein VGH33_00305 [Isosphaeraceae bacterium]
MIEQAIPAAPLKVKRGAPAIAAEDLGASFDIEIEDAPVAHAGAAEREKSASKKVARKAPASKRASTAKKSKPTPARKKG